MVVDEEVVDEEADEEVVDEEGPPPPHPRLDFHPHLTHLTPTLPRSIRVELVARYATGIVAGNRGNKSDRPPPGTRIGATPVDNATVHEYGVSGAQLRCQDLVDVGVDVAV